MGDQNHPSKQITWRITRFASLTERVLCSNIFTVAGTKWKLQIYPKGHDTEHLSVYLGIADSETLPSGWSREAMMCLTLVNQLNRSRSIRKKFSQWRVFTSTSGNRGYRWMISLSELHDISSGFLVDETVVLEAKVEVRNVHTPVIVTTTLNVAPSVDAALMDRFDNYCAILEEFIKGSTTSTTRENSNSRRKLSLNSEFPSLEDVEQAKQSLKECLSDLFKLDMKEGLAKSLLTLSLAQDGLSSDQQKAATLFWANFDDFTSDLLTFEQDNSEYDLQKLLKDKLFTAMEKNLEKHLSLKQWHIELCKEEEEFKKGLEDINSEKNNLRAEWESLLADSELLQSNYETQEKKVADAEEKKKIAEERMSRSTTAWANLKRQFG